MMVIFFTSAQSGLGWVSSAVQAPLLEMSSIHTQMFRLICWDIDPVMVESGIEPIQLSTAPVTVSCGPGVKVGPRGGGISSVVSSSSVGVVWTTLSQTIFSWFRRRRMYGGVEIGTPAT